MSGPGHTNTQTHEHTYTHTCSSVWENRDRSQPDHTIVQRKKSIKQLVHFSAEAFKNPSSHCRSFVGEDKKSAPIEIPQSCERGHVPKVGKQNDLRCLDEDKGEIQFM